MNTANQTFGQKLLAALSELFTFKLGRQADEQRIGLTLQEVIGFAAFQLVLQLTLASAPLYVPGLNAAGVAPFPIIIDLLGNILLYGGVIAAAIVIDRRDRIPLMICGVAVVALLLTVTEFVVTLFTDQARSLLGIMAFFLFLICRNGLRLGILASIVTALGIVLGVVLIKAALILQMMGATPVA